MTTVRVLLLLLASTAVGVFGLVRPPSAAAAEPAAFVTVTLTSLTPALPKRGGTVTLEGEVTNISGTPVSNLQAILWRASDPLSTAESIDRALASEADDPIGRRLFERNYQNIPSEAERTLAPGASTRFSLTTEVANLDLPRADGVYLFGVHVRGRTVDDPGRDQTLGRARTFLPLVDSRPATPLRMTTVVVLSSRPSQLRRGVLADDHVADEVHAGGRLDQLLTAAGRPGTSFAVDPELVQELETMRNGYQVQSGDGATATGRGQGDADRWLTRLRQLLAGDADAFRLLYGSPDLSALVHGQQAEVLADVVAAGKRVELTASLPLLVIPADGYADQATVQAAEQLDPKAILLSEASADAAYPLLTGLGTAPVVRYGNTSFGGGGPGPEPRSTPVQLRQRALADTWVETTSVPPGVARGRVRMVTSVQELTGEDAGVEAPWVTDSTLSQLLKGKPEAWDHTYTYPDVARGHELTAAQLAALGALERDEATYADLLANGEQAKVEGNAAVARAASAAWRGQDEAMRTFLAPQQAALDAVLDDGLRISSNPKVSTVAREGVEFPITVRNQLPVVPGDLSANTVRVKLVFVSANPQRLTIAPISPDPLAATDAVTENAKVRARANGTVQVRAQLQTLSGKPVGKPQTIDVRVTQNGTTGWAVAGAALVVFVVSTGLRIRRVGRTRAAEAAAGPAAQPPSALTSAPPGRDGPHDPDPHDQNPHDPDPHDQDRGHRA